MQILDIFGNVVYEDARADLLDTIRNALSLGINLGYADLAGADLRGCDLTDVNLSFADLGHADLSGATLTRANFEKADLSHATLRGVTAWKAIFLQADLTYALLDDSFLEEATFDHADLNDASVRKCYLADAYFLFAELERTDFSGSAMQNVNLSQAVTTGAKLTSCDVGGDIPRIKNIHSTIYNAASRPGALEMDDWHTCANTHCRAGWVVALAEAYGLERLYGAAAAATLIYAASDPALKEIPDFYARNNVALEDMKRLAEAERNNQPHKFDSNGICIYCKYNWVYGEDVLNRLFELVGRESYQRLADNGEFRFHVFCEG